MNKKCLCTAVVLALIVANEHADVQSADVLPYQSVGEPVELRVADLLARMTLAEKVDLLGGDGFKTKPNARLGIPALIMTDGPLGPNGRGRATNYSATINLAATFDTDLMYKVAENIGEETRAPAASTCYWRQ